MLSASISPDTLDHYLSDTDALSLAAVNGPTSIVIAGDNDALDTLAEQLEAMGIARAASPSTIPRTPGTSTSCATKSSAAWPTSSPSQATSR